ncbi:hypothetical protein M433DRAFT_10111 [Acidomyces richmondensis BFW]|nr:hypothetical protein M433DRAFT_10111 [Acidomyces richmondensis BFW]
MDKRRVATIEEWPTPTSGNKKGKQPVPINWGDAQEQAFRKIKAAFTEAPILRHY